MKVAKIKKTMVKYENVVMVPMIALLMFSGVVGAQHMLGMIWGSIASAAWFAISILYAHISPVDDGK